MWALAAANACSFAAAARRLHAAATGCCCRQKHVGFLLLAHAALEAKNVVGINDSTIPGHIPLRKLPGQGALWCLHMEGHSRGPHGDSMCLRPGAVNMPAALGCGQVLGGVTAPTDSRQPADFIGLKSSSERPQPCAGAQGEVGSLAAAPFRGFMALETPLQ